MSISSSTSWISVLRSSPYFSRISDQLVLEHALDLFGVGEQLLEVGNALLKLAVLVLQLLAVETLERFQAHVQYRLRLHVGQAEALHQVLLCVVVAVADDVDDLVDVVLRDEQTLQQVGALLGLFRSYFVLRTISSSWKVRYSSMMWRRLSIFGWVWLFTSASMFIEKLVCIWVWVSRRLSTTCGFASRFSSMTMRMPLRSVSSRRSDMPSMRFVAHVLRDRRDELALVDLIRKLGDDDPRSVLAELLKLGARAHDDLAAAGHVRLADARAAEYDALLSGSRGR